MEPRTMKPRRIRPPGTAVSTLMGVVLSILVLAPVIAVLWQLSGAERALAATTQIVTGEVYQFALARTALIGVLVAAIATALAAGLAWLTVRTDLPGRRVFAALVIVPFFIPLVV